MSNNYTSNAQPVYVAGSWGIGPWGTSLDNNNWFSDNTVQWIWYTPNSQTGAVTNTIPTTIGYIYNSSVQQGCNIFVIVHDTANVMFNGQMIASNIQGGWQSEINLNTGNNILEFQVKNLGGPAGLLVSVQTFAYTTWGPGPEQQNCYEVSYPCQLDEFFNLICPSSTQQCYNTQGPWEPYWHKPIVLFNSNSDWKFIPPPFIYVGVGTDGNLYSATSLSSNVEWVKVNDNSQDSIKTICTNCDGSTIIGINNNLQILTKPSWDAPTWSNPVQHPCCVFSAAIGQNGAVVGVGTNHTLWSKTNLNSDWTQTSSPGEWISDVAIAPNGSVFVVGSGGSLWKKNSYINLPSQNWQRVLLNNIKAITIAPDGSFIWIGTDNNIYTNPNYQSLAGTVTVSPIKTNVILQSITTVYSQTSLHTVSNSYNPNTQQVFVAGSWGVGRANNIGFTDKTANWIWYTSNPQLGAPVNNGPVTIQYIYNNITGSPISANLKFIVDDLCTVILNGITLLTNIDGDGQVNCTLPLGTNLFEFQVKNLGGPAALIVSATTIDSFSTLNNQILFSSNGDWKFIIPRTYKSYPNTDYPSQGDIKLTNGSIYTCQSDCDNTANCTGFVADGSNCWLKNNSVSDPNYNTKFTYYYTGTAPPGPAPVTMSGYTTTSFTDHPGNDVRSGNYSVQECGTMCNNDPGCNGFITNATGTYCWNNSSIPSNNAIKNTDRNTYKKNDILPSNVGSYNNVGNFKDDKKSRALKHNIGTGNSPQDCVNLGKQKGFDTVGVHKEGNSYQCWAGNQGQDGNNFMKYGKEYFTPLVDKK